MVLMGGRTRGSKIPSDGSGMVLPPPTEGSEMWGNSDMGMKLPGISKEILEQLAMLSTDEVVKENGVVNGAGEPVESASEEQVRQTTEELMNKYFEKMPCKYNYPVYRKAARVYQALKREQQQDEEAAFLGAVSFNRPVAASVAMPVLEYKDEEEQRLVFELAFTTLKYQLIIEDLLAETAFFAQYPEIRDDESNVAVVLCDFQHRKFQIRSSMPDDGDDKDMARVEKYIMSAKTKLAAALAKNRIKAKARSIDHLLPESVRLNDPYAKKVPIYAWVNILRVGLAGASDQIKKEGYRPFMANRDTVFEGKFYRMDSDFPDTFVFPSDQQIALKQINIFQEGKLVIQDRSSIVGPHCVRTVLGEGSDVLITDVSLGLTAIHLASLTKGNDTMIHALGAGSQLSKIQSTVEKMGASKYVRVYREKFLDIDIDDGKWRAVRAILVLAECSKTAIANPIDFIVNEGHDMSILKDFTAGKPDGSKLGKLVNQNNLLLRFALKFPRVQHVLYCTRSTQDVENDKVVVKSMEHHASHSKRSVFRVNRIHLGSKGKGDQKSVNIGSSFYKIERTENDSGCFVALLTREADDGTSGRENNKLKHKKDKKNKAKEAKKVIKLQKESTMDSDESDQGASSNEDEEPTGGGDDTELRKTQSEGAKTKKKKSKKKLGAGKKQSRTKTSQSMTARIPGDDDETVEKPKAKVAEHQKVVVHPNPFRPEGEEDAEPT